MEHLAMIVRDDAYDRLYTPLTFAYVAARQGVKVDMLFTLWAVRVLTESGAKAVRIDRQHAADEEWFKQRIACVEAPATIDEFIRLLKSTGNVSFYGCQIAAATFDVQASQLLPEASGLVDAMWFLNEKATRANHCQYF